ncbi:CaiB/BaiF CoA transferase family protein [Salinibacterium soli]|uniref:CaiB/BaiF CoA-transferase family protein n=1 Tax=Antiquaquibacter soli TaxID=3064523 RepID=A0ABT9BQ72_9MICO|nr:CaiB/BaiF CoA-transferase family protein [Protaetiibacter sp. WY-16]MDO7881921.1 CaiB/BaiF CoA-transferase family protein [Protaetiibacter sp. WY-16]
MLSGIRVISFTHFLQGPSASQILADLGADVIKVEPHGGAFERNWTAPGRFIEGESPFFALGNRNVRSIVIDLKHEQSAEVLRDLLADADVLIESFRPGTLDRLGLGFDVLHELNPRLVYASLSGYGTSGPYVDRPGQDVLLQALSGLAAATGRAGQDPTPVGACVVDQHAAVLGALGILAALHGRERTGRGVKVESNLLNAALDLQIEPLTYALNGFEPERSAEGISSAFYKAPYGVFATADGHLCISLTTTAALARVFDDEWFATIAPADEWEQRDTINARVADHVRRRSTAEWEAHFTTEKMWFAPVQDYDAVIADPQVLHNDSFDEYQHPRAGTLRVLKHAVTYDGVRPGIRTPPPELGEQTREVLAGLGYSDHAIDALIESKALA